jgi:protein SCO1/2
VFVRRDRAARAGDQARSRRAAWSAAAAILVVCTGCGAAEDGRRSGSPASTAAAATTSSRLRGTVLTSNAAAYPFALRDQNGTLVRTTALRGRLVLVAFLYTSCRDVCPIIAGYLNAALKSLGPRAERVRVLAVSVDPQGDTPQTVRRYFREHRLVPQFHWLLGTREQLAPIWQGYNIQVEARSIEEVTHSAPVLLFDGGFHPRVSFAFPPNGMDTISHDLRVLLAEHGR